MSVFSAKVIDRFIEPAAAPTKSSPMERETLSSTDRNPPFSFYPPLYITPPQQRPPSPSSFSPSPYVLNHKRRPPIQNGNNNHASDVRPQNLSQSSSSIHEQKQAEETIGISMSELEIGKLTDSSQNCSNNGMTEDEKIKHISAGIKCSEGLATDILCQQCENEVFEMEIIAGEPNGSRRASKVYAQGDSSCFGITQNDSLVGNPRCQSPQVRLEDSHSSALSTSDEFFDAPELPLDDSMSEDESSHSSTNVKGSRSKSSETMAQKLQEEVARRIRAEEALVSMQLKWNEMARKFSSIGLTLSLGSCEDGASENGQGEIDPLELLSQKILVARLVGGAVASAAVRAAIEEESESTVTIKNREIARLRDKLQYYELINHEMSQRNQEVMEIAQRRRRRRQKRQKVVLGCIGAALCVGSMGLLSYRFFPWEQSIRWAKSLRGPPKVERGSTEFVSM